MLPQTYDIPDGYDKKATLEWVDSLITKDNLPTTLSYYDFINYTYKVKEDDKDDMPNYNMFKFRLKEGVTFDPLIIRNIRFEVICLEDSLDEWVTWGLDYNYTILEIMVKTTN